METFSALLAICAGNSPVPGEFPAQRPVTRSFDVFFDLRLNKRLSKQWWGWWFETLSHPLWRHCNVCVWWNTLDYYGVYSPVYPNVKNVIFGSQDVTRSVAVSNFCIFHMQCYTIIQRLFNDNVLQLHESENVITATMEEAGISICHEDNKNYKFEKKNEILYEKMMWICVWFIRRIAKPSSI